MGTEHLVSVVDAYSCCFDVHRCHTLAITAMARFKLCARYFLIAGRFSVHCLKRFWLQTVLYLCALIFLWSTLGFLFCLLFTIAAIAASIHYATDLLLYHPDVPIGSRITVCSPDVLNLPCLNTYITTADGVSLNIYLFTQPEAVQASCPTVIYLHGNAGNIGHRLLSVSYFYNMSCNVLLLEYRGFGHSKGRPSECGLYEDAKAAVSFLESLPTIDNRKILVFGRSLGGAVAIHMAYDPSISSRICGLIVENTFTSIPEVARCLFRFKLVQYLPNWMYRSLFNSRSKIDLVDKPILFLSGLSDELVPPYMMRTLYELCPSRAKYFKEFPDGTHNFTWKCPDYCATIGAFIYNVIHNSQKGDTNASYSMPMMATTPPPPPPPPPTLPLTNIVSSERLFLPEEIRSKKLTEQEKLEVQRMFYSPIEMIHIPIATTVSEDIPLIDLKTENITSPSSSSVNLAVVTTSSSSGSNSNTATSIVTGTTTERQS